MYEPKQPHSRTNHQLIPDNSLPVPPRNSTVPGASAQATQDSEQGTGDGEKGRGERRETRDTSGMQPSKSLETVQIPKAVSLQRQEK